MLYDRVKIGMTVRLASGGPQMTVEGVRPPDNVDCVWFQNGDIKRVTFCSAVLLSDGFDVVLKGAGVNKLQVVKAVKEQTGLSLKEAMDIVDAAPVVVMEGVDETTAKAIKKAFEEIGATIELKK